MMVSGEFLTNNITRVFLLPNPMEPVDYRNARYLPTCRGLDIEVISSMSVRFTLEMRYSEDSLEIVRWIHTNSLHIAAGVCTDPSRYDPDNIIIKLDCCLLENIYLNNVIASDSSDVEPLNLTATFICNASKL